MELMAFAYGLSQIPHLKSIRFKFIQKSPFEIDLIQQFIEKILRIENIDKFDFYFRKQIILARDVYRIEKMFSQFPNVHCSFGHQSLHLSKSISN